MENDADCHKLRLPWWLAVLGCATLCGTGRMWCVSWQTFKPVLCDSDFYLEDTGMPAKVLYFGSSLVNIGACHFFFQVFYSLESSTIFRLFWLCGLDRDSLADWSSPEIWVWPKHFKMASSSVGLWGDLRSFSFSWEDLALLSIVLEAAVVLARVVLDSITSWWISLSIQHFLGALSLWEHSRWKTLSQSSSSK